MATCLKSSAPALSGQNTQHVAVKTLKCPNIPFHSFGLKKMDNCNNCQVNVMAPESVSMKVNKSYVTVIGNRRPFSLPFIKLFD